LSVVIIIYTLSGVIIQCCPLDILFSEALGWRLTRTITLAQGAEVCDFRFKKGGPTIVAVPAALQDVVDLGKN